MKQLFGCSDLTYGGILLVTDTKDSVASAVKMPVGTIAMFDATGLAILPGSPTVNGDYVTFIKKHLNGDVLESAPIHRSTLRNTYKAYVAPVARTISYGLAAAGEVGAGLSNINDAGIKIGDSYGFNIIDQEKAFEDNSRYMYYEFVATGTTVGNIVAGIIAKVNADSNRIVNLTNIDTNKGITFTAITAGHKFTVVPVGGFVGRAKVRMGMSLTAGTSTACDLAGTYYNQSAMTTEYGANTITSVQGNPGVGTYTQIRNYEKDASTHLGENNVQSHMHSDMFTMASQLDSTKTYSQFVLNWEGVERNTPLRKLTASYPELVIAVESGAAGLIAALNTVIGKI